MKTFTPMYNMVSSKFFHFGDKYPTANEVLDSDDYIVMPSLQANDLEDVYHILNMEHPKEHIAKVKTLSEIDPFHVKYPSLHSSLSVCDVVADVTDEANPTYFYCDSCGWKELEVA